MSTTVPVSADQFLAAFRARRAYCRALLDLSEQQRALIDADEYPELLALLSHKQQVLDALLEVGRQADLWRTWKEQRSLLPDALRQECEHTLAETEHLLPQLLNAEESSTELLTTRRDAAEQALCAVNRGGAAQSAYGSPLAAVGPRRLDVDL